MQSFNQLLDLGARVSLSVKREDLLHPTVSGNKFRKLKYNLAEARRQGLTTLLTFGGAFSNHIAAVAAAGQLEGFKTIGVIRGEELASQTALNPTLETAVESGMHLEFVTRGTYRQKSGEAFIGQLRDKFGDFYLIPEGGTNELAVLGCEEILTTNDNAYDFICCPVGTGGTMAGLMRAVKPCQQVLGFAALKGDFLPSEICKFASMPRATVISDYHFGGYGKVDAPLIGFINAFKRQHGILLDPLYTGKMMFGVMDKIANGYFPDGARILAIHTGGQQGIPGMNSVLKSKNLPTIDYD